MSFLNNFKFGVIVCMVVCAIITSCSDEKIVKEDFEEGLPVSLACTISTPNLSEVTSRASDAQETKIESLTLLFYKNNESLPIVFDVENVVPSQSNDACKFYNITVPESAGVTSGYWYIYAIANYDKGFWGSNISISDLKGMSKTELEQYCIRKNNQNLDIIETSMLLSGKYEGDPQNPQYGEKVPLTQPVNTLPAPIRLKRSVAKIFFNIKGGPGVTFIPETYDIYNYCCSSTIIERNGWSGDIGSNPGELSWNGKGNLSDNGNFRDIVNNPIGKNGDFMFYMPENVQHANAMPENILMREHKSGSTFTFAPEYATYVVFCGKYIGPGLNGKGNVTADVQYTVHLGDFSVKSGSLDNFTIRRNIKYIFNVSINGVNSIILEALSEPDTQPGANGNVLNTNDSNIKTLDAHYETCIISLDKNLIDKLNSFDLLLTTPKSNFVKSNINDSDITRADIGWLKFGKPYSATDFNPYPKNGDGLLNLDGLLKSFKDGSYANIFHAEADKVYIQVFADEYFYEGLELNKFINAPDREMTLAANIKTSADKESIYTETPVFSIKQHSIKSMFNLSAENPFGIEVDDNGQTSWITKENPHSKLVILGDYYFDKKDKGPDLYNGYKNSVGTTVIGRKWSTYIDVAANKIKPNYDNAFYQFLIRNRDENGDNIIQKEEIKWFMPSVAQMMYIWQGYYALPPEAKFDNENNYFTSTYSSYRIFRANEGSFCSNPEKGSIGYNSNVSEYNLVRCIRALKSQSEPTSPISAYNPSTATININGLNDIATRKSGTQKGEYLYHSQTDMACKLPSAFCVAKQNLIIKGEPGDTYTPKVKILSQSCRKSGDYPQVSVTHTVKIKITRDGNHRYYWSDKKTLTNATEITDSITTVTVKGYNEVTISPANIFADNGNYTPLINVRYGNIDFKYFARVGSGEVIDSNKPGEDRISFTAEEILNDDLCKNYCELPDSSDLGLWRVPNQREMMLMMLHTVDGRYTIDDKTGTRTNYDKHSVNELSGGIYFVDVISYSSGDKKLMITPQNNYQQTLFPVRPVRDANP